MKLRLLSVMLGFAAMCGTAVAAESPTFVNLTPKPKQITTAPGELALPASFSISHAGLSADMEAEIVKFAAALQSATGIDATPSTTSGGLFTVAADNAIAPEGYTLDITADGVSIKASTAAGLFYAFQTVKKILPPNVAIGVAAPGPYALPLASIADEPRYPWRGFELDVARHYFPIEQIYKMLDIMAVYKMNRFHWHLTDDQGWRLEMPKYPKLTTEAACPLNAYWWDFDNHQRFTTNEMYGPYFYTVDEMKAVVEYAKALHIEVCPEVDMPGHMQAAIAAYPEFSTNPEGNHPVRYYPGVSTDVLDISNPAVVQFTKDIIDQLAEIFPYEYVHIGGDECPTDAWAGSESCREFKREHGLTSDRALQNWLTRELAHYAREKHGRRLVCWNEVLTTAGADKEMVKEADLLVYAWLNAGAANNPSKQAAALGLRSVWCSTSHYYLDYPQWGGTSEPVAMGGTVNLERVYKATPDYEASKKELYYGVNCNLWTEYISEGKHLEYNALPRMIAVAETGWTPNARKDFDDFLRRFNADTRMLDLGNYTYGRHYVDANAAETVYPEAGKYYRLITRASGDANRCDRCIELVREGSPLIGSLSAQAGKLWTNTQAAEGSDDYNWQYWTFEADPANSGKYAMVNRQAPEGSVDPAMSGSSVNARWNYDFSTKHYNFVLGEHFGADGISYYYSVRSDKDASWWLNCAQQGQNLTVNNWNDPADGNGGLWLFALEGAVEPVETNPAFTPLEEGKYYTLLNLRKPEAGAFLAVDGMQPSTSVADGAEWSNVAWAIEQSAFDPTLNVQTFRLRNVATGLYVGAVSTTLLNTVAEATYNGFDGIENGGYEVSMTADASAASTVTLFKLSDSADDYVLEIDGKRLFAFGEKSSVKPNGVNARANSPAAHGAAWRPAAVNPASCMLYHFTDEATGDDLGSAFYCPVSDAAVMPACPIENYEMGEVSARPASSLPYGECDAKLRRIAWTVTYSIFDTNGVSFGTVTETTPAGQTYIPAAPAIGYLTDGSLRGDCPALVPAANLTYDAVYSFNGVLGCKRPGAEATALEAGKTYLIHDAHSDRNAYRTAVGSHVRGLRNAEGAAPSATWTLETAGAGNRFSVRNVANGLYIQAVKKSQTATLGDQPYAFIFTRSGDHFNVRNSAGGTMYWDGDGNLDMVGWDGGTGHPYRFYEIAEAEPFFRLTFEERDTEGNLLASRSVCVKPGSDYIFSAVSRPGKDLVEITGNDELTNINANKTVVVTYDTTQSGIGEIAAPSGNGVKGIFDLNGRRLNRISRPGLYIINGVKTIIH